MKRKTYRLDVTREGRWWIIAIPELELHTQAHRLTEVEVMGRDVIALWLDIEPADFDVDVHVTTPEVAIARWTEAERLDAAARQQARMAASTRRSAVQTLRDAHISADDTARLLGISRARVYQLREKTR
ncbi:hypothetical protein [Agrococcus sp. KRD186]|uniref:hypothetical protein n=1 Tax=Agrococcus sp. KRD186 TaxID=2729730 RepID=UPI0019D0EB4A|nr:hypothetical protein [Agrococcus sp. KRD186]